MHQFMPCLIHHHRGTELAAITLGHPLLDEYLEFVGAAGADNTWLAMAYDLKVFFEVVGKEPAEVDAADVFAFLAGSARRGWASRWCGSRTARRGCRRARSRGGCRASRPVRVSDRPRRRRRGPQPGAARAGGASPRRSARSRRGAAGPHAADVAAGAVAGRGRRAAGRAADAARPGDGAGDAAGRAAALRGARLAAARMSTPGERRLFIAAGKGGRERIVPVSGRFFAALGAVPGIRSGRRTATDGVFVVLKGPRRGLPLSAAGVDEVLDGARARAGLQRATCHQLRHTCLTRLREQGMALEAMQAQAGHASIDSTRIYLHLANDWLAQRVSARGGGDRGAVARPRRRGRAVSGLGCADPEVEALVDAYRADLARGRAFRRERGDLAGTRVPDCGSAATGGPRLPLEEQCARAASRTAGWSAG